MPKSWAGASCCPTRRQLRQVADRPIQRAGHGSSRQDPRRRSPHSIGWTSSLTAQSLALARARARRDRDGSDARLHAGFTHLHRDLVGGRSDCSILDHRLALAVLAKRVSLLAHTVPSVDALSRCTPTGRDRAVALHRLRSARDLGCLLIDSACPCVSVLHHSQGRSRSMMPMCARDTVGRPVHGSRSAS
jgi:hypothetical protein